MTTQFRPANCSAAINAGLHISSGSTPELHGACEKINLILFVRVAAPMPSAERLFGLLTKLGEEFDNRLADARWLSDAGLIQHPFIA